MTKTQTARVKAYWEAYLESLSSNAASVPVSYQSWGFGDSPEMADALGALVLAGTKTATASLVWAYEAEKEPLPEVGDHSIILNGGGESICIIETTAVRILPFDEVDAEQAYLEGEGDRSLAFWRAVHWEAFGRECEAIGRHPSKQMPVLCERFHIVFRKAAAGE